MRPAELGRPHLQRQVAHFVDEDVEQHIRQKLDLRSRAQIGTWLASRAAAVAN
jgi:hypothetical protein